MKTILWICVTVLPLLVAPVSRMDSEGKEYLHLVQTIPLPEVKGRIDHMDVDTKGKRLFAAGLENGSIEVVDLKAGKRLKSIPGFQKPQGIAYVPSLNKICVASGDDGMLRVFRGDTLDLLHSIKLDLGANRVIYDPQSSLLYVGYGGKDAGKDYRLFLGTRTPPRMITMDSNSGKEVSALPTAEGMDGVYFNAKQRRIYVSGGRDQGEGFVFIYQQTDADHYDIVGKIPTRPGAGTSFWSPDLNRYYVAAPAYGKQEAAILVFEPAT
jgi:DNA-binding beta-propeller fold protein YncE